ncbi:non-hydrolyzing UDP-N-acetylglucosamine 2-epimerase [Amycolatopsis pittospori]|uniref:non-hydrolyzing UDP-N-acetylglucosamine 2-epimerase n=1 Tax=Amycolatopsis pittospori TaxID=2749434 RepID=UPI0015F0A3B8|nr:UDP-N-acetylglucosamine 2-epimerase (non-hydrolyzing) [Amycolatopsis pittospori]
MRNAQHKSDTLPEIWLVAGTRPEAVKLAPVARALSAEGRMRPVVIATGQHPEMVDQALATFGLTPDERLTLNRRTGSQPELLSGLLTGLEEVAERRPPAAVVVQGDTTTTLAGALAAFWRRVPVVHLEAGLRSFDMGAPFPEELNRKLVTQAAALHLAPTPDAAANLRVEGVPDADVLVAGNTVVDAILTVTDKSTTLHDPELATVIENATRGAVKLMLVTLHRRESWGEPMRRVLRAVAELLDSDPELRVVLPAHPNPEVRGLVREELGGNPGVLITGPLPYTELAATLAASTLVLSDSGGIQEEAPTFGVPVLVLRDVTERMEAVNAGCALLVGTDGERIVSTAKRLLDDPAARTRMMSNGNPFGDGAAAERTEQAIAHLLGLAADRPAPFRPTASDLAEV